MTFFFFFFFPACIKNNRCIILAGDLVKQGKEVCFCNVYALNVEKDMVDLWNFILNAQISFLIPWCIGGDFNTVLCEAEGKYGEINSGLMKSFNIFVVHAMVIDIPLQGISFTWSNNREQAFWAHLDKFLISPWILFWFPKLSQKGLPRSISDHSAVMIGEPRVDPGPYPFRFYNDWLEDDELMSKAKEGKLKMLCVGRKEFSVCVCCFEP